MTLDPKDLTAEERAIVDNCALFYRRAERDRGETAEWCYVEGFEEAEPIILARRKLYGEPQGAKAVCPNCKKAVVHRNEHVTAVGDEGLLDGFRFTCQPAPPPAPVAGELALPVQLALEALRHQHKSGVADGLEFWARSQAEETEKLKSKVKALSTLSAGLESQLDKARSQAPAQPAVGMTPELEMVLEAAHAYKLSPHHPQSDDYRARLNDSIAAVRKQAASAQPVARDLPKVRGYFDSLANLPQYQNAEGREFIAEIRAELDAQPKAVPVEAIRALLNGITSREQRDAVRRYLAAVEGGK